MSDSENEKNNHRKEKITVFQPSESVLENFTKIPETVQRKAAQTRKKRRKKSSKDDKIIKDLNKELKFMVHDAFTALYDMRNRNAERAFSLALELLDTALPEQFLLSKYDELLLLYGRASALTEIGLPETLSEAQQILTKMKASDEKKFQCLIFYGIGRVYLRKNNFSIALQQFLQAEKLVKNKIMPGRLTWPLNKDLVRDTEPEYFKDMLERSVELCKFPPVPDAICRSDKCRYSFKARIYVTDPDFKGYVQVFCCQSCKVEFHIPCWKTLKIGVFSEKNEKDILKESCLTPDCVGQISCIQIFGPTGSVKCKLNNKLSVQTTSKKQKVYQKCVKKSKWKEDPKVKPKNCKQSLQAETNIAVAITESEIQKKKAASPQTSEKAWLIFKDPVLLQISRKQRLFEEEKSLQFSALISCLKPWLELDVSKGNRLAENFLNMQDDQTESFGLAVELLLQRRNRVWARVFICFLSSHTEINPQLSTWAVQLNTSGLKAAQAFIERHLEHFEHLNLAVLLNFEPMKNQIVEKVGTAPEIFPKIGLTVSEFLKQAPAEDMRLFIWTLEEHRDDYPSCHSMLDEYFDMMDGNCLVFKKTNENKEYVRLKVKTRSRKKKPKETKLIKVIPCVRGIHQTEEEFFPLNVPDQLQQQATDSENQSNDIQELLNNKPFPTKKTWYDFFAEILEEFGPLQVNDPIMVSDMEDFPDVALQRLQKAGGLESFLLKSRRFIKIGKRIGLTKHAAAWQQANLDELDDVFGASGDETSSPHLYPFNDQSDVNKTPFNQNNQVANFKPCVDAHPDALETTSTSSTIPSVSSEPNVLMKDASVQTDGEVSKRCVAVNTLSYDIIQRFQDELTELEKSVRKVIKEENSKQLSDLKRRIAEKKTRILENLEEIKQTSINKDVTQEEVAMEMQKLVEQIKKDHMMQIAYLKERDALENEVKMLHDHKKSLEEKIQDNKTLFKTKTRHFFQELNQTFIKKTDLEDAIQIRESQIRKFNEDSLESKISAVETKWCKETSKLQTELRKNIALLKKMDEVSVRFQSPIIETKRKDLTAKIEELQKKCVGFTNLEWEETDAIKNQRNPEQLPTNRSEAATSHLVVQPATQAATPAVVHSAATAQKRRRVKKKKC